MITSGAGSGGGGGAPWLDDVRTSYDRVASDYHRLVAPLLDGLPLDRALLGVLAERVGPSGSVVELGCGTGVVTGHLLGLGVRVAGLDASAGMVAVARAHQPALPLAVADLLRTPLASGSVDGVLCWFVLQHVPDDALPGSLLELRRVLRPGGTALVGFHAGSGSRTKTEGYGGHPMRVGVHRRSAEEVAGQLERAGFAVDAQVTTPPTPTASGGVAYLLATAAG